MELIAAGTIWGLFGAFLIFPLFGLPAAMHRTAMTLLTAELLALMLNGYGSGTVAAVGRSAASIDVPLLGLALVAVAIMRAWRSSDAVRPGEGPRHGFAREGGRRGGHGAGRRRPRGDRV